MGQYLDKFASMIGQTQTEQVLKLLNKKRDTGQIRTVKEFSKELEDTLRELTQNGITPMMQIRKAMAGDVIEDEIYNFMLDGLEDDLVTAFKESEQLEIVQNAHEALIRDLFLRKLREGLEELRTKITVYKFLNSNRHGFDRALYTTFKSNKDNRLARTDVTSSIFLVDPRTGESISPAEDALVDILGEKLVLPQESLSWVHPREVRQILDSSTSQSLMTVEPPTTSIKHTIDGKKGTYWLQAILTDQRLPKITSKIEISLQGVHELTIIELEPVLDMPLVLDQIYFKNENGMMVSLGINPVSITEKFQLPIPRIATDTLVFEISNSNPRILDFEYPEYEEDFFNYLFSTNSPSLQALSNYLSSILPSEEIRQIIGLSENSRQVFSGYSYTFGIDNIRVGFSKYGSKGLYIAKPFSPMNLGVIGLKVKEQRPYIDGSARGFTTKTYDIGSDTRYLTSSLEYWVLKEELSESGSVLNNALFPILPINVQRIHHERLILNQKSQPNLAFFDIGQTLFMTNITDGNVLIYRNGVLVSNWTDVTSSAEKTPNSGSPMRLSIKIDNPQSGDIYTVSYDVIRSTTLSLPEQSSQVTTLDGLRVVDLVGDLSARLVLENIVATDKMVVGAVSARYTLKVLLRRNTKDVSTSASLDEYFFLGGTLDSSKFGS